MFDSQNGETSRPAGPRDRRCAVVAAGIETGPLVDALRSVPHTRVGDVCIFPSNGHGEPEADYLILAANDSSRFLSLEDQIDRWSGRRTRVLLALPESKCAMLGDLPRRADGLILLGSGLKYLEESLELPKAPTGPAACRRSPASARASAPSCACWPPATATAASPRLWKRARPG
jgi:hypothetical protein